jgi:hypothetical protein
MSLFGSARDISMFRRVNRELLQRIIDTEVAIHKIYLDASRTNIYGESQGKSYYQPVRVHSHITRGDQQYTGEDYGMDITQTAEFRFLRDDLVDLQLVPEAGDVVLWDESYWEIDAVQENKYVVGKNADTSLAGNTHGASWQIVCLAHLMRESNVQVREFRYGNNNTDNKDTMSK